MFVLLTAGSSRFGLDFAEKLVFFADSNLLINNSRHICIVSNYIPFHSHTQAEISQSFYSYFAEMQLLSEIIEWYDEQWSMRTMCGWKVRPEFPRYLQFP